MKTKIEQQEDFWIEIQKLSEAFVALCNEHNQVLWCDFIKENAFAIKERADNELRQLTRRKRLRAVFKTLTDEQRAALSEFSSAFRELPND